MNRKEFIVGLLEAAVFTSISKCFATSISTTQTDEIHKYAVKATNAYMQTYGSYPNTNYSFKTVIELPVDVRRSYNYSKQDVQAKLEHWFVDKCYETVNKYKGHAITFDVDPWLTRKAQV